MMIVLTPFQIFDNQFSRGVQLLCGVVAEQVASGRSKKELEAFVKGNPGMLPPSSTGLRRNRSDGARRSERKAVLGEAGAGAGAGEAPRRLFIDQQHRDQ